MMMSIELLMSANVVGSITVWPPRPQELVLLTFMYSLCPWLSVHFCRRLQLVSLPC